MRSFNIQHICTADILCLSPGRGGPCGSGRELHVRAAGERDESPGGEGMQTNHYADALLLL